MLEFILIASALTFLALLFFAPTLFRNNFLPAENYDVRNTQIARESRDLAGNIFRYFSPAFVTESYIRKTCYMTIIDWATKKSNRFIETGANKA